MFSGVYKEKRVLVTGHTGFKGSWLSFWLTGLGANVAGFSLGRPTEPCNFDVLGLREKIRHYEGDIRDRGALEAAIREFAPDMIFHLAAQSLVRQSFADPVSTIETNVIGTMNVLECLREQDSARVGVIITSDKCYRNVEWIWGYRENDPLGGEDPYSASKAGAEIICHAYIKSFLQHKGARVATVRAGNVIGGGDWAPDRVVPDCVRAWSKGRPVVIRHPDATRPWQHVLEPLSGYLWLGARLWLDDERVIGQAFNFGPSSSVKQSVLELIRTMADHWPGAAWEVVPEETGIRREAGLLKLSCDKALAILDWEACLSFVDTVRFTSQWYKTYYQDGANVMQGITEQQIHDYTKRALDAGLPWTQ